MRKLLKRWKRDHDYVITTAGILGMLILFGILMHWIGARATVYVSWPDQVCRKVEPAHAGSCEDLPTRYEVLWVDPRYE